MNPERGEEELTVTLTRFELGVLLRGGRVLRMKAEKQMQKDPDFVPEPGKMNVNQSYVDTFNSALDKIEQAWGTDLNYYRN
jgi:hypothetical protein